MRYLLFSILIGAGATLVMDLWAILRQRLLGVASLDYGLVGRWLGRMAHGEFVHASIATASPVRGERLIGWVAHYLIGIAFAALLLWMAGPEWLVTPTIAPAMIVGLATVAAPFLLMQPAMGAGVAASRTPRPWTARLQSLITHAIFGLGLYATGYAVSLVRSLQA
jgi:hypothetical protein